MHELLTFLHKTELITEPFDLNQAVIATLNIAKEDGESGLYPELKLEKNMLSVLGNKIHVDKVMLLNSNFF